MLVPDGLVGLCATELSIAPQADTMSPAIVEVELHGLTGIYDFNSLPNARGELIPRSAPSYASVVPAVNPFAST
jgi:hypothetical protein